MTFEGTAFVNKEGGVYVGRCPELGVRSEGDTMLDVLASLREAVRVHLEEESREAVSPEDVHLSVMRVEVEL